MLSAPTNLHFLEAVFYGQVIHPITAMKARERVEIYLSYFLTSTLVEGE